MAERAARVVVSEGQKEAPSTWGHDPMGSVEERGNRM